MPGSWLPPALPARDPGTPASPPSSRPASGPARCRRSCSPSVRPACWSPRWCSSPSPGRSWASAAAPPPSSALTVVMAAASPRSRPARACAAPSRRSGLVTTGLAVLDVVGARSAGWLGEPDGRGLRHRARRAAGRRRARRDHGARADAGARLHRRRDRGRRGLAAGALGLERRRVGHRPTSAPWSPPSVLAALAGGRLGPGSATVPSGVAAVGTTSVAAGSWLVQSLERSTMRRRAPDAWPPCGVGSRSGRCSPPRRSASPSPPSARSRAARVRHPRRSRSSSPRSP